MINTKDIDITKDLVSVIMPAYNCEKFIANSLDSVINQTYQNWEIIVVNDCSTDATDLIINHYTTIDSRVKYFKLNQNYGAAIARNKAIENAKGKYLAFLDSDDLWFPEKLSIQIAFMRHNNYHFTCTSYSKIDEDGKSLERNIIAKGRRNYDGLLKTCPGNSTVIYNSEALGKFYIPDIRKRNDYVMWLQIIKKEEFLYCIPQILGCHRVQNAGISRNKKSLIYYHWIVYRNIERLSIFRSSFLILYWIFATLLHAR